MPTVRYLSAICNTGLLYAVCGLLDKECLTAGQVGTDEIILGIVEVFFPFERVFQSIEADFTGCW